MLSLSDNTTAWYRQNQVDSSRSELQEAFKWFKMYCIMLNGKGVLHFFLGSWFCASYSKYISNQCDVTVSRFLFWKIYMIRELVTYIRCTSLYAGGIMSPLHFPIFPDQVPVKQTYFLALTSLQCTFYPTAVSVYISLTLSARPPFQNFSTPCILNVNNTGAKQGTIMK
jgi:hypothetical protein